MCEESDSDKLKRRFFISDKNWRLFSRGIVSIMVPSSGTVRYNVIVWPAWGPKCWYS